MQYSTHLLRHLRLIIGQNIHRRRVRRKLSLEKLSHACGIAPWLLDCYELGRHDITLPELFKISCALDMEIVHMLMPQ